MFDPLPNGSAASPPALRVVSEWTVLQPVPEDAPVPPSTHPKLRAPSRHWEYRDTAGWLLGIVCRFDPKVGDKEIRSLVFAEHKKFGRQWRWLGFPKPRPLYGLDRLAARLTAPVILCEGEKAADAAGQLLPDHVATTSAGGSKAAAVTDWAPLAGRKVTIWPDADEAGQAYARDVSEMLERLLPAPAVAIVNPPEGIAEGWDAADAMAEGWAPSQAAQLVGDAAPPGARARRHELAAAAQAATRRAAVAARRGRAVARPGGRRLCDGAGQPSSRKP